MSQLLLQVVSEHQSVKGAEYRFVVGIRNTASQVLGEREADAIGACHNYNLALGALEWTWAILVAYQSYEWGFTHLNDDTYAKIWC